MKVPLNWLENYIKLKHAAEDFGKVMTQLEFMQDGPIEVTGGQQVIDLEVRQNRPDMLSIIGVAREYAAYIDKEVELPEELAELPVEWGKPDQNLQVTADDLVKRFCAVEIKNVEIKDSPRWVKDNLEAYGIPAINNIVDITNYVMLEYGMPLHAFDIKKLQKESGDPLLNLRMAKEGEKFTTWQGTQLELTKEDLVVADSKKPIAIAGIIGGANSDIDQKTNHIILEAATYHHSAVRRSSIRHAIRTDASTRHEKFLNPEMVETAVKRALFLIKELAGGEVVRVEDFYEKKHQAQTLDFNVLEVERLGGVQLDDGLPAELLKRLGFSVIEHKEAIGLGKNILVVNVPQWRTDINYEADLVEEVLRLFGYDNIPMREITTAAPDYSTSADIQLEEKIRDILVNLGLYEQITNPIVKFEDKKQQILLENPLNKEKNALRISIRDTLKLAGQIAQKAGSSKIALFEVGKIYLQTKIGEYKEIKTAETLYLGHDFLKIKGDFLAVVEALGISNLDWKKQKLAELFYNGFVLYIEKIADAIEVEKVPYTRVITSIPQIIEEEIDLVLYTNQNTGEIAELIKDDLDKVKSVTVTDIYEGGDIGENKKSVSYKLVFEDTENKLTREFIEKAKSEVIKKIQSRFSTKLRNA